MIGVNLDISSQMAFSALAKHQQALNQALTRLATGKMLNKASDDPAGMVAATEMESQLRSITKKIDGNTMEQHRLGSMEGAYSVVSDLVLELEGLVVASANEGGLSAAEREANQIKADSILKTLTHLADTTMFKGQKLMGHMTALGMGLNTLATGGELNLIDGDMEKAQEAVRAASASMAVTRGAIGSQMNSLDSQNDQLRLEFENISAAKSDIVDTDFAAEVSRYVRADILKSAAEFMARFAMKHNSDTVLALLG
jgi:flagellin